MSISGALAIAASGLRASSRQAEIASNNIANAGVEGFVRKSAGLAPVASAGKGQGIVVQEVLRHASAGIARDARREAGAAAFLDVQAETLLAYTNQLGQPDEARSVAAAFSALEQAFVDLAASPEQAGLQRAAVAAADRLATGLNALSGTVRALRDDAEGAIRSEVGIVNDSLRELERVNDALKLHGTGGKDTTGLEDQRERLIDRIAERIPVRVLTRAPNDVLVLTEQGVPLFDGKAAEIGFTKTTTLPAAAAYAPGGAGPGRIAILSGLTVDGRDLAPGSGDAQVVGSGRIAGLFAVRDDILPGIQRQLDEVASVLIDRFQDPATDPSLAAGTPGLFTAAGAAHDRSDPAAVVGLADRIAINASVDPDRGGEVRRMRDGIGATAPGPSGGAAQVLRFLDALGTVVPLRPESGLPASTTLRALGAETVGAQQATRASAGERAERQSVLAATLRDARADLEGVNTDTELQRLIEIEKAFAANANVIQVATRMLDDLLQMV